MPTQSSVDSPAKKLSESSAASGEQEQGKEHKPVSSQVYIDGKCHPQEEAKVSVFDHTLRYGDGVFEGIRVYDGCIFRLREHLERIYDSAHFIMLKIPLEIGQLTEAVAETIRRNDIRDGYVRLVVTRGVGTLGLAPWKCGVASVIIIADTIQLYPDETYEKGLRLLTVPTLANHTQALNSRVKSCNYLNNILAKIEAHNSGFEEALMLDGNGFVVECTGDNIFLVKKGVIFTPPVYLGALDGVTRGCIIEIAREKGYEVREEPFTRYEVFTADECFLTGTAAEVIPVVAVDGRAVGNEKPGTITRELTAAFRARTKTDGHRVYE